MTPNQVDAVDEILLGHSNWVDSQHIPSNNGSYRLNTAEAKAKLKALLVDARIDELKKWTGCADSCVADRIKELEKQREITE